MSCSQARGEPHNILFLFLHYPTSQLLSLRATLCQHSRLTHPTIQPRHPTPRPREPVIVLGDISQFQARQTVTAAANKESEAAQKTKIKRALRLLKATTSTVSDPQHLATTPTYS